MPSISSFTRKVTLATARRSNLSSCQSLLPKTSPRSAIQYRPVISVQAFSLSCNRLRQPHPIRDNPVKGARSYELSEYDHTLPGVFIIGSLFFSLPDDADKKSIASNVQEGLRYTLENIPIFAGRLHQDGPNTPFQVRRGDVTEVEFNVQILDQSDSSFPSLEKWGQAGYSDSSLTAKRVELFPVNSEPSNMPMGLRMENGCPMFCAQLNFIKGGVILVASLHHFQSDLGTIDVFLDFWARSTRAISEQSSLPTLEPSFDRSYFNTPHIPSKEEIPILKDRIKGYRYTDIATTASTKTVAATIGSESIVMPETVDKVYHIPRSSCERLKAICQPLEPGKFVSTYDCIVSLTWRATTRARIPFHPEWDINSKTSILGQAVDIRGKFPDVSRTYVGNAIAPAVTDPIPIVSLLNEKDGLATTASACRQSILSVTRTTIPDVVTLMAGLRGRQRMDVGTDFLFGSDFLAASYTGTRAYKSYDFGFGLPICMRLVPPPFDGTMAVYPARQDAGPDEGLELVLRLEKSCQDRILLDKEFMQFAEIRDNVLH